MPLLCCAIVLCYSVLDSVKSLVIHDVRLCCVGRFPTHRPALVPVMASGQCRVHGQNFDDSSERHGTIDGGLTVFAETIDVI